jgi:drug/metabolite transporter (DMT)-like permease
MDHPAETRAGDAPREAAGAKPRAQSSAGPQWLPQGPLAGMICILLATACFASMNAIIRGLSHTISPIEIAFFRSLFGLFLLAPFLWWYGLGTIRTHKFKLHATRGVVHAVSMMIFFVGLSMTPLTATSALEFAAPLVATTIAILFLGEAVRVRRLVALAIGYVGVLIVVRPGLVELNDGQMLILVSVAMWAGCQLMIRELSKTESAFTQGFYMVSFFTPITFVASLPFWTWPDAQTLLILFVLAVIATSGTWLYGEAFRRAEMSAILPLESTKLIWATMLGWVFFVEVPDPLTLVGGAVIFAAAAYITIREAQLGRKAVVPLEVVD